MKEMETGRKEFMSYEYKTVTADADRASFLLDGYENFGWELDDNIYQNAGEAARAGKQKKVTLRLKRNRKIINKMELTRLQRNFEQMSGNQVFQSFTYLASAGFGFLTTAVKSPMETPIPFTRVRKAKSQVTSGLKGLNGPGTSSPIATPASVITGMKRSNAAFADLSCCSTAEKRNMVSV